MDPSDSLIEAASQIRASADTKKCLACGCLRLALDTIDRAGREASRHKELADAIAFAKARLVPKRYECLGCEVCYPAVALNALGAAGFSGVDDETVCPTESAAARVGWPPLPGSYKLVRYHAPVAVCALNSPELIDPIIAAIPGAIAIAGTLQTENLGIERLVTNVIANPFIRFVVVCGADSRNTIGHLPGQSLLALARHGIDANRRIVNANGKRPMLRNLAPAAVEHFRATVEVIDLIGTTDVEQILTSVRGCLERDPGPGTPFSTDNVLMPVTGAVPQKMVSDPAGYFIIFVDRARELLNTEHYMNNGVLTTIIEGRTAAEVYMTAIARALLSRLDHAAYLGREPARAEQALSSEKPYIQDAAPEQCSPQCSCHIPAE